MGKKLAGRPREAVAVALPEGSEADRTASALVEGLIVATRGPDLRKGEPSRHPFGTLAMVAPREGPGTLEAAVRRGEVVGEAVNLARELANMPPAEKSPTTLAARARSVGEAAGLTVTVWDPARIERERFGGLLGVAAGSDEPPSFVILEHRRGGDAPTIALVGKGVTFDSGGLSLKPSASMEDMKADMTGAAAVLAAMTAVARLGLEANVVGYLAITENMVNGKAMKLGDVLTMRNGKTVEILNTDAEGRLILADALSYAAEQESGGDRRPRHADRGLHRGPRHEDGWPLRQRRPLRRSGRIGREGIRRAHLADAARRRRQGSAQEPRGRPQERRREVGRGDHGREVPRTVRRQPTLGPPRHRRPELGRRRGTDPRRGRHRLLRPDPRPAHRGVRHIDRRTRQFLPFVG